VPSFTPSLRDSRWSSLTRFWCVLGVLAILVGRLSSTIAPFAALFAPVVCSICHGCAAKEHDHVCDCEACELADQSSQDGIALLRGAPHGAATDHAAAVDAPALVPAMPRVILALVLLDELSARETPLSPRPPPAPAVPPPRRFAALAPLRVVRRPPMETRVRRDARPRVVRMSSSSSSSSSSRGARAALVRGAIFLFFSCFSAFSTACVSPADDDGVSVSQTGGALRVPSLGGRTELAVAIPPGGLHTGPNTLTLAASTWKGAATPVRIVSVRAVMAAHNHEADPAALTPASGETGAIDASLLLFMTGRWELEVRVEAAGEADTVAFSLDVP
jgi:hypothetical protein